MKLPILCLLSASLVGCDYIEGSGRIVVEQKEVEAFHAIDVTNGLRAEIVPGPQRVELRLDDNIIEHVQVEVEGGVLRLDAKDDNVTFDLSDEAIVLIFSPTIDGIKLSDGATARAITNAHEVEATLSDGAELHLTTDEATFVEIAASDGSRAFVKGDGAEVAITSTDGASVECSLPAQSATIEARDGSDVLAHVSEAVHVGASDGSEVRIVGNPEHRDVSASDGSSVEFDD